MSVFLSSPLSSRLSPVKSLVMSRTNTVDTAAESPYKARVQSIGKRFNEIQANLEVSQNIGGAEQVESKIKNIDGKITDNYGFTEEKFRLYSNEISKLEEEIGGEISTIELLNETCSQDVVEIENNLAITLQKEQQNNKESSRRALGLLENKINHLRDDFAGECRKIEVVKAEQSDKISEEISHLKLSIKNEGVNREEAQENIIKKFSTRLSAIRETIKREQKIRAETENFLFSKIEEINHNLQIQAKNEREKRERTETQMLTLLEEACIRYEEQVRIKRR